MKTKQYTVTGTEGANLRVLPSSLSEIAKHLNRGERVQVAADFTAVNTAGGVATPYLCVEVDGKHLWTVSANLAAEAADAATTQPGPVSPQKPKSVNYLTRSAEAAKKVYPLCIGKVHSGKDASKVVSLASLKSHHSLSCNRMMSITLQEAGLLEKGQVVSHTKKRKGKKSIADAVKNVKALRHCKVIWVNKRYRDLPAEYKKAGVAYIQNSNACVSAGNGRIWSCNRAKGHRYKGKSDYYRSSGYPFTSKILVVIVPDSV